MIDIKITHTERVVAARLLNIPVWKTVTDRGRFVVLLHRVEIPATEIRAWVHVLDALIDADPDHRTLYDHPTVYRVLALFKEHITATVGADWITCDLGALACARLIAIGRSRNSYEQFVRDSRDDPSSLRTEYALTYTQFFEEWLYRTTLNYCDALAYEKAGISPGEAVAAWEPMRVTNPDQWATQTLFLAALCDGPGEDGEAGWLRRRLNDTNTFNYGQSGE